MKGWYVYVTSCYYYPYFAYTTHTLRIIPIICVYYPYFAYTTHTLRILAILCLSYPYLAYTTHIWRILPILCVYTIWILSSTLILVSRTQKSFAHAYPPNITYRQFWEIGGEMLICLWRDTPSLFPCLGCPNTQLTGVTWRIMIIKLVFPRAQSTFQVGWRIG